MQTLRLATRESALALWQSEHVAARLREAHPGLEVVLVPMTKKSCVDWKVNKHSLTEYYMQFL